MKKHNLWEKREESTNTLVALTEQTNFVIYMSFIIMYQTLNQFFYLYYLTYRILLTAMPRAK